VAPVEERKALVADRRANKNKMKGGGAGRGGAAGGGAARGGAGGAENPVEVFLVGPPDILLATSQDAM